MTAVGQALLGVLADVAIQAGEAVMRVYTDGCEAAVKTDGSPVTDADLVSSGIIMAGLAQAAPDLPVCGEEDDVDLGRIDFDHPFLLVDPLDGTREFVNRNGEFTINIALIERRRPVMGVVYAPALSALYMASQGCAERVTVAPGKRIDAARERVRLTTADYPSTGLRVALSRSHLDGRTAAFASRLSIARRVEVGSSLKFCRIAEGAVDVYPRLGPTMEWDTAAGHAVLTEAGGIVVAASGEELQYGKSETGLKNGAFVAWGRNPLVEL